MFHQSGLLLLSYGFQSPRGPYSFNFWKRQGDLHKRNYPRPPRSRTNEVLRGILETLSESAAALRQTLNSLLPDCSNKLQEAIDEIISLVPAATDDGLDIVDTVNAVVEITIRKVESARTSALNSVKRFLDEAEGNLFRTIKSLLSEDVHFLFDRLRKELDSYLT